MAVTDRQSGRPRSPSRRATTGQMTLFEHLAELRTRLIICVIAVIVPRRGGLVLLRRRRPLHDPPLPGVPAPPPQQGHQPGQPGDHRPPRRLHDPAKISAYLGIALAVAGAVLGAVAVHHPRPSQEREALHRALRGRRGGPLRRRGHHRHPGLPEGAGLADLGQRTGSRPPSSRRAGTSACTWPCA